MNVLGSNRNSLFSCNRPGRNEKPRKQVETIDDLDDDAVVVAAAAAAPCVGRDGDTSVVVVEDDIVEVGERSLLTDRADSEPEDEPVRTQIVKVLFDFLF